MPAAPLAKGLIISFSLLFAAGIAVYENPQVRLWVDESRRKVAIALHSLGDELSPSESRPASPDASTREDNSPEAAERRYRARQEILERGRIMEERRQSKRESTGRSPSFDDMVDQDGSLKIDENLTTARSSAAESQAPGTGLRHRAHEPTAAALGSAFANPFADEMGIDQLPSAHEFAAATEDASRCSTPTLPASPPVPPKPEAYQPQRLLIDTDDVSNHPSEQLLDLTPTTSASSAAADLAGLNDHDRQPSATNYWSVNEWTQTTNPIFYTPPQSEPAGPTSPHSDNQSCSDSVEHCSRLGSEDMDVLSDDGVGVSTPGSWTEVGSQVSEDL